MRFGTCKIIFLYSSSADLFGRLSLVDKNSFEGGIRTFAALFDWLDGNEADASNFTGEDFSFEDRIACLSRMTISFASEGVYPKARIA